MNALLFLIVVASVALSGCAMQAAKPNVVSLAVSHDSEVVVKQPIHIDPIRLVGVVETPNIRNGNYSAFRAKLPSDLGLKGEFHQDRVSWIGAAFDPSGREYPIQFVWTGCHPEGGLRLMAIVEGARSFPSGTKAALFSTMVDRAFALDTGLELTGVDDDRLKGDPMYRRESILAQGTAIDSLPVVEGVGDMLRSFRRYRGGTLLVPPTTSMETVDRLMRFNPRETYSQKYTATAGVSIVPNVTAMVVSNGVDAVMAAFTSCRGWHEGCGVGNDAYLDATMSCTMKSVERSQ